MQILQEALEQSLGTLPQQILSRLIADKLVAQGIKLSPRDHKELTKHILQGGGDTFSLRRWDLWNHQKIRLEFTSEDVQIIEKRFTEFLDKQLFGLIQAVVGEISGKILADLKRKWRYG